MRSSRKRGRNGFYDAKSRKELSQTVNCMWFFFNWPKVCPHWVLKSCIWVYVPTVCDGIMQDLLSSSFIQTRILQLNFSFGEILIIHLVKKKKKSNLTEPWSWPRAALTTPFRMYSWGVVGSRSLIRLYASGTSSDEIERRKKRRFRRVERKQGN